LISPFHIKEPSQKQLSQFGYGAAVICAAVAAFGFYKQSPHAQWWLVGAVLSVALTLFARKALALIFRIWMTIGATLGWINLHILMALLLYLVFTPIRLIQKIFSRDLLDRKIEKDRNSYLSERKPLTPDHFDRMF